MFVSGYIAQLCLHGHSFKDIVTMQQYSITFDYIILLFATLDMYV